ncbi:hypothetical protein RND71_019109 [Anisodus tanguticus]|uniref:Uncharacterized protein n=1 Tax=Anisodus tanguticus TaxID=243964 RepID=A0AAE1V953_9SOLA|nr:hypothetical protein RND71_019109 [Anisodus tanguticus]
MLKLAGNPARPGSRPERRERKEGPESERATATPATKTRDEVTTTTCRDVRRRGPAFRPPRARGARRPHPPATPPRPAWRRGAAGATRCVTPSARAPAQWLRAQLAFKDSMVHGILQFTPSIAFRYVLHRCESRDIRCRESFSFQKQHTSARARGAGGGPSIQYSLALSAPGFVSRPPRASTRRGREGAARRGRRSTPPARGPPVSNEFAGRSPRSFDNDPSAGSMDFSQRRGQRTARVAAIRTFHRIIQSVGATAVCTKGSGRSQREPMTRARARNSSLKTNNCNDLSPSR